MTSKAKKPKKPNKSSQSNTSKRIIIGIILGLILAGAFVLLGGGRLVSRIGNETESAGKQLQRYEHKIKKEGSRLQKKIKKGSKKVKSSVEDTVDDLKDEAGDIKKDIEKSLD